MNISDILQQLPAREAVVRQLENEFKGRITELQKMESDLLAKMEKLQRDGKTMKASDRTRLENGLMTERTAFAEKAKVFEEDNLRRQKEERNKILSRIQDAVKVIASKNGYDIVVDANAVVYMKPALDVTAEVLKRVQ